MAKKKIEGLLKGVAITGTAVGGMSVLGNADLVYAQVVEDVDEGVTVEVADEATAQETVVQETTTQETTTQETTTQETVETPTQDVEMAEFEVFEVSEAEVSQTEEQYIMTSEEYEYNVESLSIASSEYASESEFVSNSVEIASESLSTAISETTDDYVARSEAFKDGGFENDGLVSQAEAVEAKIAVEEAKRAEILANNKKLNNGGYYTDDVARSLAIEMIKFKLILTGEVKAEYVDKIEIAHWNADGGLTSYDGNHFVTRYFKDVGGEAEYVEDYYDYVTADSEGNSLFKAEGSQDDNPAVVTGINIVKKIATFSETSTKEKNVFNQVTGVYEKIKVATRSGFAADSSGSLKGDTWYKESQFKEDANTARTFSTTLSNIAATITQLQEQLATLGVNEAAELSQRARALETDKNYLEAQSTAIAESESISEFERVSESERVAESESLSSSESASESVSAIESASSSSESASSATEATSESASTATASAGSTSTTSSSSSSSSSTAAVASTTTATTLDAILNAAQQEPESTGDVALNAANSQQNYVALNETTVPLAVIADGVDAEEIVENNPTRITTVTEKIEDSDLDGKKIGDEEVAKSKLFAVTDTGKKSLLYGLAALVGGKVAYDKSKKYSKETE